MIGFLKGRLHAKQPPFLLIDVQGVGYRVEAPMSTFYALGEVDSEVVILTQMHVREDAMLLYGFATESEKALFKELIKVNGVGAKMAMAILSALSVTDFVTGVEQNDVVALTRIPGVGKKTAERLIIEMRDKLKVLTPYLKEIPMTSSEQSYPLIPNFNKTQDSAIEALVALGYKLNDAEKMVKAIDDETLTLENIIKLALQNVKV